LCYGQRLHALGVALDAENENGVYLSRVTYDPPVVYGPVTQRIAVRRLADEVSTLGYATGGMGVSAALLRPASNGIRTAAWLGEFGGFTAWPPVLE
jgi:hypothetical protein